MDIGYPNRPIVFIRTIRGQPALFYLSSRLFEANLASVSVSSLYSVVNPPL